MASSPSPGPPGSSSSAAAAALRPDEKRTPLGSPAVRFATNTEEIEPDKTFTGLDGQNSSTPTISGDVEAELRAAASQSIGGAGLQSKRMGNFSFDPVSLPASRVPSHDDSSRDASRYNTNSSSRRPSPSPRTSRMNSSPGLTPAGSHGKDDVVDATKGAPLQKVEADLDPSSDGPQIEPPGPSPTTTNFTSSRPGSSDQISTRNTTLSQESTEERPKHRGSLFDVGPLDKSAPSSREHSPTRGTGNTYTRPFTPRGDANDPYAASKRLPQSKNLDDIAPRFHFSSLSSRHRTSPSSSSTNLPKSRGSSVELKPGLLGGHGKKDPSLSHLHDDSSSTIHSKGSMSELKRFLKIGGHHKAKSRASSPSKSGTRTPPHHKTPQQLPFSDDHGLQSKYGKFGKALGSGAGGSVRLMKRGDGTTFAVKEFRPRREYESVKEYTKKVTAEFCVGSTLHHGNIIETLDIVQEKGKWYEVMEYAPYDLFAIVMTGKMSREEVTCSFLQILSGVTYLHAIGLAHRDLKLDNVVVNDRGIMKIIDFGSASMFQYPFEKGIVLASGIVGSDPYLAPEVYDERKYDPRAADIWSLAIIFCCMSLRRFPWKMPRTTDNSYKLFVATPTPGTDPRLAPADPHSDGNKDIMPPTEASTTSEPLADKKPEVLKGPWRLLRLLPRESRHIIGRMLTIDPKQRANMEEILEDPWVKDTQICVQRDDNEVIPAPGHTHTLEPPGPAVVLNRTDK